MVRIPKSESEILGLDSRGSSRPRRTKSAVQFGSINWYQYRRELTVTATARESVDALSSGGAVC